MNAGLPPLWIRPQAGGITLTLAVQPGARTTAVVGVHGGALKVKVAARPLEGAANEALLVFLAECLGVRRRDVDLVRGASSRQKIVQVKGVSLEIATSRLTSVEA